MATGKITQVIGTVVDVEFPPEEMPGIFNALETSIGDKKLVLEVEQHIGNNWVRCLAMGATEGLVRFFSISDIVPLVSPALAASSRWESPCFLRIALSLSPTFNGLSFVGPRAAATGHGLGPTGGHGNC